MPPVNLIGEKGAVLVGVTRRNTFSVPLCRFHLDIRVLTPLPSGDLLSNRVSAVFGFFSDELNSSFLDDSVQHLFVLPLLPFLKLGGLAFGVNGSGRLKLMHQANNKYSHRRVAVALA